MKAQALLLGAILLLAAGCGGGDDEAPPATHATEAVSVSEAKKIGPGDPLTIEGYVVQQPNSFPRLCESLAESSPPQCGEPSFTIEGPDPGALGLKLEQQALVQWTAEPVLLTGVVRKGGAELFIEEVDR